MNNEILLESLIERANALHGKATSQSIDLIVAQDFNGLNNGVFLIRNTKLVDIPFYSESRILFNLPF
jgi:hypothetical protein